MSDRVDQDILVERTNLLFENGKASGLVVIISACILSAIMRGQIPDTSIIAWLMTIVILAILRLTLIAWRKSDPEAASPQTWGRRYTVATLLIGLCWVWLALIGYGDNAWLDMVILLTVVGIAALAVPVLVSFPLTLSLYFLPGTLMVVYLLLAEHQMHKTLLALALVIYCFLILRSAKNFYRLLLDSLRLRFNNESLALILLC